ncbi:MAG: hypothetical protein N3B12_09530, partial [Armatimonadetes bacterium]|nr:hypothetical protein [Armatimonadota bacterium]
MREQSDPAATVCDRRYGPRCASRLRDFAGPFMNPVVEASNRGIAWHMRAEAEILRGCSATRTLRTGSPSITTFSR